MNLHKTEATQIADLHPWVEKFHYHYDRQDECAKLLDMEGTDGTPPFNLKQTEFSYKPFAQLIWQPNYSRFNKWNKLLMAGFLGRQHQSIIQRQICLKQLEDRSLYWETAVAHVLATFEYWIPFDNIDNAEWIWWQWVEMFSRHVQANFGR